MINNFTQIFSDMLSTGVLRLVSIVLFFMTMIAMIDFILAFIFEYSADMMTFLKVFFTKIFRYTIFFAIARFYVPITDELVNIIFKIGYLFFPSGKIPKGRIGLPDFDEIFSFLFDSVLKIRDDWAKLHWTQFGAQLTYLIIVLICIIGIFLIIKEIIINFVEIKVIIALGVLLLPFSVYEQTKSIGAKLWNALLNSAGKLLVSLCLTGITLQLLQKTTFNSNNNVNIGNAISWAFLLSLCAYLITNSKELGNMLINGTGSSNVNGVFGQALGVVVGGATAAMGGAVVGASAVKGGLTKGMAASRGGKNLGGILKAAKSGMKEGASVSKNSRLGKIGSKFSRGMQNAVGYATGNRSAMNMAGDLWGATFGTASDQVMHDGERLQEQKDNIAFDSPGDAKDYISSKDRVMEAMVAVRNSLSKNGPTPVSKLERYREAFREFREHMNNPENKEKAFEKASEIAKNKKDIYGTRKEYETARKYNPYKTDENGNRVKKDIWNEDIGKDILRDKKENKSNDIKKEKF
ncbi:type IV secretion system protein [Streptobacillus moniliformis]|uniref:TrbL/VirB6 plasmid conjugal transfer protein n=1 Tax=Streptobacillus moniliformis (strain ATCC 14647 / DSM 12112 / NCTC 10651 / 9901) TaxID=519441 RepID=D1AYH3_STRM9|nr:type IV secretion system protein [Streptobacillus moniliformis]ACZ01349.1 hypothetical protein Smon_0882 [Streptobacillus moniliformis DSM 12112]AVL43633.1 hypothetical protein CEP89_07435 [Streptobacillus moniliformis]SQA13492.1 conjugal transfer protein TrbL [Streptobacillus moniliformis]